MINQLSRKIFFLIMISLGTIILGIIMIFTYLNYNNTINSTTMMMDRLSDIEIKRVINDKPENDKTIQNIEIEGLYNILIENSKVIENTDTSKDKSIEEYAIKVSNGNKESGIIGKYIYKIKKERGNIVKVVLMESQDTILQVRIIQVSSILISFFSLIIIYIIAKKVSKIIVKPVEATFEKQKQFISDASHELKTPLAVIEANVDVLANEVGENKWMGYIQNEIVSMNKLINELLLLAKVENVDNNKDYKQFDLSKETEIIISMFESMAYEKKVILSGNVQDDINMNGIKEDVEHILSTLIDNAIKHTEEKKEVIVELKKVKNDIIIQVKNMGNPILEEERQKIFERFYRIDKSRNRKEKRYGLGLSIAKSTVEKYNGNIEVLYKEPFTIFKVIIPA